MIFSAIKRKFSKLFLLFFAVMLPLLANSATEEELSEKHVRVAMRMIGHEVLLSLGDSTSRVLPIEHIDGQYKISFEIEFGLEPNKIVSIIDRILTEARLAGPYVVEVEQCQTKEVVHAFEMNSIMRSGMTPCESRDLPEDCYSLLITLVDKADLAASLWARSSNQPTGGPALTSQKTVESNLVEPALLIFVLLSVIGIVAFFLKRKNSNPTDPNLVTLGASQFDKRNMALSYADKKVELSHKETELLALLLTSANATIKREILLQRVWGDEGDYIGRTLDVFISKLRKKLEADTSVKIVNIRGVGYKLVMNKP